MSVHVEDQKFVFFIFLQFPKRREDLWISKYELDRKSVDFLCRTYVNSK